MSRIRNRLLRTTLLFVAIGSVAWTNVEKAPSEGAINIAVPGFGEDGLRIWEMRASRAITLTDGIVDVNDLLLTTFSGPKVETVLKSPNARFRTEDGNATSDSLLLVSGPGYEISGKGWEWDANRSRVKINANVKAVFNEEFDHLFK
jgi:hypothetical protein